MSAPQLEVARKYKPRNGRYFKSYKTKRVGDRVRRVSQHVAVAEAALGKPLPPGAQVHHVDGNGRNNANRNLVICQDQAYHRLLHMRANVRDAGGDPNTHLLCARCKSVKPFDQFNRRALHKCTGFHSRCRECTKSLANAWYRLRVDRKKAVNQ